MADAAQATTTTATPSLIDPTKLANVTGTSYAPEAWNVSSDQTVNGLLSKYLDKSNPLFTQAQTAANQQMATRGLTNSSMAVGAANEAVYKAAMPMAQQDAQTYARNGEFNASAANQANQFGASNAQQANLTNAQAANSALTQNSQLSSQASQFNAQQSNAQSQFNASQSNDLLKTTLDMTNRTQLANIEANYKTLMQANSSAGELYQQAVKNITDIQGNKDMDAGTKASAISNQLYYLKTGINMFAAMDNIPGMSSVLTF